MKRVALLFVFLSLLLIFNSCNKVKGNGDAVSETRNVTGFTSISLSMEGDVHFTPDSVYSIEIQAQQNILDVIESQAEGGILVLKIQDHTILGNHDPIRIYIHAPSINGLDVSGSGNITVDSKMDQRNLHYKISGSGNITLDELKSNLLDAGISGSGNVTCSSGRSDIEYFTISGSGNLNFQDVMADSVFVTISGSGDVTAYAVKYLDVTISGSGNVRYNGNPVINMHISGSGNVAHL